MLSYFKKIIAAVFAGCFIFLAAAVIVPQAAKAQATPVPLPTITTQDIPKQIADARSSARTILLNSTKYAIMTAILTAVDTSAQRIAANAATWVVTGGNGQSPLAYITGWNNWHDNILMDSVSDSVNALTTKYAGFGVCAPINTSIDLKIKLGIARLYAPKPNCTFNQAYNAAVATGKNITSGKFLSAVTLNFEMGSSPLSVALNTQYAVVNKSIKSATDSINQRLTSPYKPLTDAISGNVKTPANIIEETALKPIKTKEDAEKMKQGTVISSMDLLAAVGSNALKIFTSTLASKAIEKYLKNGTLSGKDVFCASSAGKSFDLCKGIINENVAAGTVSGSTDVALATAYFASLFTPAVNVIDDYSPLNDLSACPTAPEARGVWNCVIDQGFVSALSPGEKGYITVAEAVKSGLLHGNWQLIPAGDQRNNSECYTSNYCHVNLVKLRRMRIIPVGWEMAAAAGPVTLDDAIKGFAVPGNAYYRLVDPNWILKVPVTQCKALVKGQTLEAPDTGSRADVCVDAPSCISEDGDGKCTGGFGYCTRERSVWRVDATECPAHYASCDTFSDPDGKDISVLKNTLDASSCNATNAGCRPFLTVPGPDGWVDGQPSIYLTSKAQECDSKEAGCRGLQSLTTANTANIIPNPGLETATADGNMAEGWGSFGGQYLRDDTFSAFEGTSSFHVTPGGGLKLGGDYLNANTKPANYADVMIEPNSLYTVSFYAKRGATNSGALIMKMFDGPFYGATHSCPDGSNFPTCLQNMAGDIGYQPTCTATAPGPISVCRVEDGYNFSHSVPSSQYRFTFPLSAGYERYTTTFATPSNARYVDFLFYGGDYYIDAIQLETGATATAFHAGGFNRSGLGVNLKVPPAYLGCTGEADEDIGKGCSSYAPICRQSEVGCDKFSPRAGGAPITAVISGNDACNSKCVGYDTFKQEPTLWASARFPLFFIPSTAKTCSMSEVGCDEFTNLEAAVTGGETKAYYTYIRACRQPDAAVNGNYFTWEGSDASGYQLKSFVLVNQASSDGTMNSVPPMGEYFTPTTLPGAAANPRGPVYLTGTDETACTLAIYNGADKNPDCRQFFDADGNIFYRLLSKTITATADCKTYRKTISSQTDCQGSGGIWSGGSCDYFTLPAESRSCSAAVNGCRAFTGNKGNNVKSLLTSTFENNQTDNWTGGTFSSESTAVGEHSYVTSAAQRVMAYANASPVLVQGRAYTLTLWAKGTGSINSLFVGPNIVSPTRLQYFSDPNNNPARLTTEWQFYRLGPVVMDWRPDGTDVLRVAVTGGTGYFDNIQLNETQGVFALVSGSWKTPAVCDQTSAGQSLPQAQLGCAEYTNRAGLTLNLKSFDHLCRAQAVGCEAFTDGQGTDTPFASFYNAKCSIAGPSNATNARDCMWNRKVVCSVPPAATDCRFNFDGSANQLGTLGAYTTSFAADTHVNPADVTHYLVNDGNAICDAASVGCTALGDNDLNTVDKTTQHRIPWKTNGGTVYKTIVPANLKNQLCTQEAVSCQAWSTPDGNKTYFKDPGAALCEYKEKGTYRGNEVSGWFKKGTQEPCDPNFVIGGRFLGIRKNLDSEFVPDKRAGLCPAENAGCTEFTDHADPGKIYAPPAVGTTCQYAINPATCQGAKWCAIDQVTGNVTGTPCRVEFVSGRPFYYINDDKIKDASAACPQVSQKQGCLLLDQTDNPKKTYDTVATYNASNAAGFDMVDPVIDLGSPTATPPVPPRNDANIKIKVTRDRVCSEWLECNTDQTVVDPQTGRDSSRCLGVGSCIEKGADGRCLVWDSLDSSPGRLALDVARYRARDVTASGSDFSGFSIPKQLPVWTYKQSSAAAPFLLSLGGTATVSQTCKVYPEADSPFPRSVLVDPSLDSPITGSRQSGFNNANICEGPDCECTYRKAVYGQVAHYYPPNYRTTNDNSPNTIPQAICAGGPYDGKSCNPLALGNRNEIKASLNLTCINGDKQGECTPFTKIDSILGQNGYCLEHDDTLKIHAADESACITWFPIETVQGRDQANQFLSAAFIPKINQENYCTAPAKYCVPRDCGNSSDIVPLCTKLKNTKVVYTGENNFPGVTAAGDAGHSANCFDSCNRGSGTGDLNSQCITAQTVCGNTVREYCYDGYKYDRSNDFWGEGGASNAFDRYAAYCTGKVREIRDNIIDDSSPQNCQNFNRYFDNVTGAECTNTIPRPVTCILADTGDYCNNMNTECMTYENTVRDCRQARSSCTSDAVVCDQILHSCLVNAKPINHIITDYCALKTRSDLSCTSFVNPSNHPTVSTIPYCQDIYNACLGHATPALSFCKSMDSLSCFGSGYGVDALCSHDLPGIYGAASFAAYDNYQTYNTSAFCGVTGFDKAGQDAVKDLTQCSVAGAEFCGANNTCRAGKECTALNDLSVSQNEFTVQEQYEGFCLNPAYGTYMFPRNSGSRGWTSPVWNYCQSSSGYPKPLVVYKTKPTLGANTMFGASTADKNGQYLPLLSSSSIKFKFASQDGDWVNVYDTAASGSNRYVIDPANLAKSAPANANNYCTEANGFSATMADPGYPATINPYPMDFLGMYYLMSGSQATVSYDMVSPPVLLTSQIDRVTIKVLSNMSNGLCQYGSNSTGARTGQCWDATPGIGSPSVIGANNFFAKSLFDGPSTRYGYFLSGLEGANVLDDPQSVDDQNFSSDGRPSFIVLSSANNWSGGLSSTSVDEGNSLSISLIISESSPKRVIGVKVSDNDAKLRGYFYIASMDVHLRGPACGQSTFIGSSNPFANPSNDPGNIDFAPVAFTNSVNTIKDFVPRGIFRTGSSYLQKNECKPFGAYSASSPTSVVTQELESPQMCELNKGTIYATEAALYTIFPKGYTSQFNSSTSKFEPSPTGTPYLPTGSSATDVDRNRLPTINNITINNQPSYSFGSGSLRAHLQFDAHADTDHMPIRSIVIDWGDNTSVVNPDKQNYYKNHESGPTGCRAACGSADCFGGTADACVAEPFKYSHTYSNTCANPVDLATTRASFVAAAAGATMGCEYHPTITVTDNWGASQSSSAPHVIVAK